MHITKPAARGIKNAAAVHLRLPVSFFIVKREAAQGKWFIEKSIVHTAVDAVQPFWASIWAKDVISAISLICTAPPRHMKIMGRTVSLAGKPIKKAVSIIPLSPIICAGASRKWDI